MTTTTVPQSEWLPEPTIEFFEGEGGRIESAYIALRTTKYARAVQPNAEHLVFLYVGADDMPVGIRLLEPAVGVLGAEIMLRLLEGDDGLPMGVDRTSNREFQPMTLERMDAVIHRVREANMQLQESGCR